MANLDKSEIKAKFFSGFKNKFANVIPLNNPNGNDEEVQAMPLQELTDDSAASASSQGEHQNPETLFTDEPLQSRFDLDEIDGKIADGQIFMVQSNLKGTFCIAWKFNDEMHALRMLDEAKNESLVDLCEFIVTFLSACLEKNHSGIDGEEAHDRLNLSIPSLADENGLNLFFHAVQAGNTKIVEILLEVAFSVNSLHEGQTAADVAYKNGHFETILLLLQSNSLFPFGLNVDTCPQDIQDFVKMSQNFHDSIQTGNLAKITEIIDENPNLRYFYNLNNHSASSVAIANKKFEVYELLLCKNLIFSEWEYLDEIVMGLSNDERSELREIHFNNKKDIQEQYLLSYASKSFVGHDEHNVQDKLNHVMRAFQAINRFAFIQILLKVAALLSNLLFVFDFSRDSVEHLDPTQDRSTLGLFYGNGRIYVGAKQLLDPATEHEVFATIAHELCHFVLYTVFGNFAKPYDENDSDTAAEFDLVLKTCELKKSLENIINAVFSCYIEEFHHAELIVRVPHIYAHYHNRPDMVEWLRGEFEALFTFYETKVVPKLETELKQLKAKAEREMRAKDRKISMLIRILVVGFFTLTSAAGLIGYWVYEPTYSWVSLSPKQQLKVLDGNVRFAGLAMNFSDVFGRNESSGVFGVLNSQQIRLLLTGDEFDLSEAQNKFLESEIFLVFENMTENLREKEKMAYITFQGENFEVEQLLRNQTENFLNSLDAQQTVSLIKNESQIEISRKISASTDFYIERRFIEKANDSLISVMFGSTSFQHIYRYLHDIRSNSISSNAFAATAGDRKFVLLSDDAGTGKTTTFEQLAMTLRKEFPLKWIEYVVLKSQIDVHEELHNATDILDELVRLLKLRGLDSVVFRTLFRADNVIILWDGFDEISPTYSSFMIDIMLKVNSKSQNIQFISTRPHYENSIKESFNCTAFKFRPYTNDELQEFLSKFYALKNLTEAQVLKAKAAAVELAIRVQNQYQHLIDLPYFIESPLLLQMIAVASLNSENSLDTANLYAIYRSFIEKKVGIASEKGQLAQKQQNSLILRSDINLIETFQYFAFRVLYSDKYNNLKIMKKYNVTKFNTNDLSRYGIVVFDSNGSAEFTHRTFAEFFVAQFFIDHVYEVNDDPRESEMVARLDTMITLLINSEEPKIREFVTEYLRPTNETQSIRQPVRVAFRTEMRHSFYDNEVKFVRNVNRLCRLFSFDRETLEIMWDIDEDTTLFNWWATMDIADFTKNIELIRVIVLRYFGDDSEKRKKLIYGRNQKGNVLYGVFKKLSIDRKYREEEKFDVQHALSITNITVNFNTDVLLNLENFTSFYNFIKPELNREELRQLFMTNFVEVLKEQGPSFWSEIKEKFTVTELQKIIYRKNANGESILYYIHDFGLINILFNALSGSSNKQFLDFLFSRKGELLFNKQAIMASGNFEAVWEIIASRTDREEKIKILSSDLYAYNAPWQSNLFLTSIEHGTAKQFRFVKGIYIQYFNHKEMREFCRQYITSGKGRLVTKIETIKAFVEFLKSLFMSEEIDSQFKEPTIQLCGNRMCTDSLVVLLEEITTADEYEAIVKEINERQKINNG